MSCQLGCPAKKIGTFTEEKTNLCGPVHPQGIMPALPPYWYQLVARPLGFLPFPSLKETLRLFKHRKKFCPKLEKVLPQNMTPFPKIQFCIYYIFNKFSFLHDKDRRRKSFAPNSTSFSKIQTYILYI